MRHFESTQSPWRLQVAKKMVNAGWALPSYLPASKQIHTFSPIMLERTLTLAVLGICPHIVGPGLEQQRSLLRRFHGNLRVQTKKQKTHAHTHTFTLVREAKMGASARKEAHNPHSILGAAPIHISIPSISVQMINPGCTHLYSIHLSPDYQPWMRCLFSSNPPPFPLRPPP